MSAKLLPYLNFPGTTKEAMEFYKTVMGGELTMQTFGDAGAPAEDGNKDGIMHAELKNDDLTFMASDANGELKVGSSISMSLVGTDEKRLTEIFNKLAEGGDVEEPLKKAPWGDMFGMLTDKFGIHWMFNISSGEQTNG